MLGLLVAERIALGPPVLTACAGLGLTLMLFARGRRVRGLGEFWLGASLGALALSIRLQAPVPTLDGSGPVPLTLLGTPERSAQGCRSVVWIHAPAPGRALLYAPPESCAWLPGQRAFASLALAPLAPPGNPGQHDASRRWARRGIQRTARVREALLQPLGPAPRGAHAQLVRLRRRLGARLAPAGVSPVPRASGLLRALVTGDRGELDEEVRRAFRGSGTAHLLAVSGLHVGWVFFLAEGLARLLLSPIPGLALRRRARTLARIAGALIAGLYAFVSGPGVPALRSASMASLGILALLGGRPAALWNGLALAALLVLALRPGALFELPFALSFAAVAGILLWQPTGGTVSRLLQTTVAAGLATAPLVAAMGAPFPRLGLLANLIAVPFFGVAVLPLALLAALLGLVAPVPATALATLARLLAELGIRLLEGLAGGDLLAGLADPPREALLVALTVFGIRLAARGSRRLAWSALAALALLALTHPGTIPDASDDSALFLDVGHGDATLVRSGAAAWLIDAGPRFGRFDAGRDVVLPALRAEGVRALDVLVLTHPDLDHVGGARAVLDRIPVAELWISAGSYASPALRKLRRAAARRDVPLRWVARGDRAVLGAFVVRTLWPPFEGTPAGSNESALVLRFDGPRGCLLLPADVPREVERTLALGESPCAVLKLAHHGSRTSTDARWLEALQPWLAVASAGRRMRGALPHREVRQRLHAASVTLYVTRDSGAVRVRFTLAGLVATPRLLDSARWPADLPESTRRAGGGSASVSGGVATRPSTF
ncbi:MAG: DNA internalization-related competence protein ComEC/Rec2 [Myxococcota bacterium]